MRWLSLLAGAFILTGCTVRRIGESEPPQLTPNPGNTIVSHPTGFQFPARVGDFTRVEVHNFDSTGQDTSYGYNGTRAPITATIYIYPKPGPSARTHLDAHFREVCDDVSREHTGAKVRESGPVSMTISGKPRNGFKAVFTMTERYGLSVQPLVSELGLFEYKQYFVMFRFTYPASGEKEDSAQCAKLTQAIPWPDGTAARSASH